MNNSNDGKKTILIVEDDEFILETEKIILEEYGYNVIAVNTGEKAIEKVNNPHNIDLILMDINLGPGIDGTKAAEKILEQHDIPIIFLSAHTNREIVEKTEGITSYGYIVKTSGVTVLIASVKMAFRLFEAKMKEQEKEKKLRASEERFRRFAEASAYGFGMASMDGNIIFANTALLKLVEEKRTEDFYRNNFYNYYTSAAVECLKNEILPIVYEKGQWVGEIPLLSAKGNIVLTEQNIFLIKDEKNHPQFLGNIITDIFKRKRI